MGGGERERDKNLMERTVANILMEADQNYFHSSRSRFDEWKASVSLEYVDNDCRNYVLSE